MVSIVPEAMGQERAVNALDARSTLFAGKTGLEKAKALVTEYKTGKIQDMNPDLWYAKKVVDSTLHPGTATNPLPRPGLPG